MPFSFVCFPSGNVTHTASAPPVEEQHTGGRLRGTSRGHGCDCARRGSPGRGGGGGRGGARWRCPWPGWAGPAPLFPLRPHTRWRRAGGALGPRSLRARPGSAQKSRAVTPISNDRRGRMCPVSSAEMTAGHSGEQSG